jgi:uncharacterized protein (DUF2062 family)
MNLKSSIARALHWLKENLKKLFLLRASAHQIAFGAAIGIFVGIFPTFGLGGLIVLGIAPLVKFNVPAAFIGGSLLSNPIFAPLWIFLSCKIVGIDFSTIKSSEESIGMLLRHYSGVVGMYVVGNTIISTTVAIVFYGVTYALVTTYRKRISNRGHVKL